jgi:hypothetical protein
METKMYHSRLSTVYKTRWHGNSAKNKNIEIVQFSIAPLEKLTVVQSANILSVCYET